MQKLGILALAAGLCSSSPAADYFTGMAARAVIGQRTFTAQDPGPTTGTTTVATSNLLGGVSGIAYANGMLFAVDDNRVSAGPQNNRVLLYRDVRSFLPGPNDELPVTNERCQVCVGNADLVLGQPDFEKTDVGLTQRRFNRPTAVATDGRIVAVADTDNNRVLIWRSIPTVNDTPADLVLGQPDFTTRTANEGRQAPTARSFRGPQGVWIQNNRLYVADTLNNRVLVWRAIPTQNFQNADIVLGQPDFTTATTQDLRAESFTPRANTLLDPVSVTSDGTKLLVTDLGHNRVVVWNSIPDANNASADLALGQPDLNTGDANNVKGVCPEEGTKDADGNDVFPYSCFASMDFPRFALSDGTRLFVADGGNDRILVWNRFPTRSGQRADSIIGQIAGHINQVSDSANPLGRASADSVAAPMALATDGTNLFVSDPFRRRIMVFTPGETLVAYNQVRNLFSRAVYAIGTVTFAGTVKEGDEISIKIGDAEKNADLGGQRVYKYKIQGSDNFGTVIGAIVGLINGANNGEGDPQVLATANTVFLQLVLTARVQGEGGNDVNLATEVSTNAVVTVTASGATLTGGQDAAKIAPGTLVTVIGENLSEQTVSVSPDTNPLPRELGGVQIYIDGIRAPLVMVSPTEVRAQVPWEVSDANSVSAFLRIRRNSGTVLSTAAVAVPIIAQNPGILAQEGPADPRPGIITHFSSKATGTVSVDGTANAGDIATIIIEDREYSYTVVTDDTLEIIANKLIEKINANPDEKVTAFLSGVFTRIRLQAKIEGDEGNGIAFSAKANDGGQVILTATNSALCCANTAGSLVTPENPAKPGETIVVTATGLGLVNGGVSDPQEAVYALATGFKYTYEGLNRPNEFVSSLAGGKTANVLYSGLKPGTVGIYEVHLELNSDMPTNPQTQVTIAQDVYVSNIVTFPLRNPAQDLAVTPTAANVRVAEPLRWKQPVANRAAKRAAKRSDKAVDRTKARSSQIEVQ
jgi:uncharacterized protein (TIGR03437 family)